MPFMLKRFYTSRYKDINVIFPQSCLSKNHFLSKKVSKKVPCIMFMGLKMIFSKTAPKMAQKRIKNVVKNIYFLQVLKICFSFSRFFTDFAPYQGRPPEPLKIFRLLTYRSSSQYMYKQSAKGRTGISSKLILLEISN
jgi:hypothetical protein